MSVIIRLQNLPWSANATDIRQFFKGLGIPDGGVHIVGGETGDAFIAFSTDDDARKAMRLDGGKLKEIQVRLFLSSRAEMQEVIESARQTTMSLMQMQRQPQLAAPAVPPAILTPQSPPQVLSATNFQAKLQLPTPTIPTIPTPLPGLITQQMYQQQIQQQHQHAHLHQQQALSVPPQHHQPPHPSLNQPQQKLLAAQKPTENGYGNHVDDRSDDRDRNRHRRRYRSDSSRSRSRSRSNSPRSRTRGSRRRYSRDRSTSRDRDRDRRRRNPRTDKNEPDRNGSDREKRPAADAKPHQPFLPNAITANAAQIYPPNMPFSASIPPFGMNKNPVAMVGGMNNAIDQNLMSNLLQQQPQPQSEQMSAFSTNDVRTMNMNMSMQSNPLAFQQQLYNQQQQANNMPAFNTFAQGNHMLKNAQQQQLANAAGPMNMMSMGNNGTAASNGGSGGGAGQPSNFNPANVTTCVRVRNLCNTTNYSAIRKFFSGILIPNDGIKMINDGDGNRTGNALVKFARPASVALAIQRSNQRLGRNIVQVQDIDEKSYDEAVDSFRPSRRPNAQNYRDRERGDRNDRNDRGDRGDRNDRGDRGDRNERGRSNRDYGRSARDYSDSNDEDDEDRHSHRSDNDRDNDVMCISDSNDSKEPLPFTTVLIEDLPPFTKEQDIMKLFSSYPLVHIVMAKRSKMFSSYVKFHSADDARAAVKDTACHKISFKTVYVSACSEEEFEVARREFSGELDLDIAAPRGGGGGGGGGGDMGLQQDGNDGGSSAPMVAATRNSGEAKRAPGHNHADAMSDDSGDASAHGVPNLSLDSIPGVNLADPRINAAKFPFINNLPNADAKPMERVDPRTKIPVQPVNPMAHYANMMAPPQSGPVDAPNIADMCCILVENMEYRTTEDEIVEWIQDRANVTALRIQLLVNERNQTNGNGFVQFSNSEQAGQAMETLDKSQFKTRFVRVSLASWQQIQATLANITQTLRENGFDGIDTSGNQPRTRFSNNTNAKHPTNGSSRFNNGGSNSSSSSSRGSSRQNNRNGCVVSMTNVPYKANVDDILDFFNDFDLLQDDVIRRYNDEGKPTGDARVRFESPAEARRAIDLKDKCRILSRPVYLQLL